MVLAGLGTRIYFSYCCRRLVLCILALVLSFWTVLWASALNLCAMHDSQWGICHSWFPYLCLYYIIIIKAIVQGI